MAIKRRCGQWPFNLPSWFPLTEQCIQHDKDFERLTKRILGKGYKCLAELEEAMKVPYWAEKVGASNTRFKNAMRGVVASEKVYFRKIAYDLIYKIFTRLIDCFGFCAWKKGTTKRWLKLQE